MYTTFGPHDYEGQKRTLGSMELKLQVAVSHYVDAENQNQFLCKKNEDS